MPYVPHDTLLRAYENYTQVYQFHGFWNILKVPKPTGLYGERGWQFTEETANRVYALAGPHAKAMIKAFKEIDRDKSDAGSK